MRTLVGAYFVRSRQEGLTLSWVVGSKALHSLKYSLVIYILRMTVLGKIHTATCGIVNTDFFT